MHQQLEMAGNKMVIEDVTPQWNFQQRLALCAVQAQLMMDWLELKGELNLKMELMLKVDTMTELEYLEQVVVLVAAFPRA